MAHNLVTEATRGSHQGQDRGSGEVDVDVSSIRSMAGKMTTFMVRAAFEKIHAKLLDSHQGLVQRLVAQTSSSPFAQPGPGLGSEPGPGLGPVGSDGQFQGEDREDFDLALDPPNASLSPVQGLAPHRGNG